MNINVVKVSMRYIKENYYLYNNKGFGPLSDRWFKEYKFLRCPEKKRLNISGFLNLFIYLPS